jgi:hypothetical protein
MNRHVWQQKVFATAIGWRHTAATCEMVAGEERDPDRTSSRLNLNVWPRSWKQRRLCAWVKNSSSIFQALACDPVSGALASHVPPVSARTMGQIDLAHTGQIISSQKCGLDRNSAWHVFLCDIESCKVKLWHVRREIM